VLPDAVIEALAPSALVVEVGVGGRFDLLAALAQRRPDLRLVAVDRDPEALADPPSGVHAHVDDVHDPTVSPYREAELVLARRPPAELQPAIARLARRLEADLALRALKDEWADLAPIVGEPQILDAERPWRWWPREDHS
jgi:uncharacterized UPF0146 family protein